MNREIYKVKYCQKEAWRKRGTSTEATYRY